MIVYYCPDCGRQTAEFIEETEPDELGEYKEVVTCRRCLNIVYIVRGPSVANVSPVSDIRSDGSST